MVIEFRKHQRSKKYYFPNINLFYFILDFQNINREQNIFRPVQTAVQSSLSYSN